MARLKVVSEDADLFSYAALDREDEVSAREEAALIKAHMRSAAESMVEIGRALRRQQGRLTGRFVKWIEAEFQWDMGTAYRFMHIADCFGEGFGNCQDLSFRTLAELAAPSTPAEVRDQVEALVVDGQKVTAADVRRLKQEAKGGAKVVAAPAPENFDGERQALKLQITALQVEISRLNAAV